MPRAKQINITHGPDLRINKHLIMGYLFLALVFVGAISSVYYWEYKAKVHDENLLRMVESGERAGVDESSGKQCAQVITPARNKITGEIREFPSPCHVTENWVIITQGN